MRNKVFQQTNQLIFLSWVSVPIFSEKYYWAREEFPQGRGQIHLHLLGIGESTLDWMEDQHHYSIEKACKQSSNYDLHKTELHHIRQKVSNIIIL